MLTSIALINKSSKTNAEVQAFASAMNKQITLHVAPAWQRYGVCWMAKDDAHVGTGAWRVYLYDEPRTKEEADCLGFHETDGKAIVPVGYIFTKYAERDGSPWTGVGSHEVLEMLGDEWINDNVVRYMPDNTFELWPREWCDAVQGQLYEIDGVHVSNFLYPAAFVDEANGPYDHLRSTSASFQITKGGYSSILRIKDGAAKQVNLYGDKYPEYAKEDRLLSRKSKRFGALNLPVVDHIVT